MDDTTAKIERIKKKIAERKKRNDDVLVELQNINKNLRDLIELFEKE